MRDAGGATLAQDATLVLEDCQRTKRGETLTDFVKPLGLDRLAGVARLDMKHGVDLSFGLRQ